MNRRRFRAGLMLLGLCLLPALPAAATVHEVNQVGTSFSPADITILQGDTVRWIWSVGVHTVTSGDPASCTGNGLFSEPLDGSHPIVEFTFDNPGVYDYFCIPHCAIGMNGSVTVSLIHEVNQIGLTFDPPNLAIHAGETVRWIWNDGIHTVTSGNPAACMPDGLFDEPLTAENPIVEFTFTEIGLVDYYCTPHCALDMNGSVTVEVPAGVPDRPLDIASHGIRNFRASPNPFRPGTTIGFELTRPGQVRVDLYDAAGRRVTTLADRSFSSGAHSITWDGRSDRGIDLPSGIYYAKSWMDGATVTTILNRIR